MAITTILMWIFGGLLVQVAIGLIIDKLRHPRTRVRAVKSHLKSDEGMSAYSSLDPKAARGKNYSELSAILAALSPEPEGTAPGEDNAELAKVQPKDMLQRPE